LGSKQAGDCRKRRVFEKKEKKEEKKKKTEKKHGKWI
jgi:hypothetical protein